MNKYPVLACVLSLVAAVMAGCNPAGEFRDIVESGNDALSKEDAAYRNLKAAAEKRGEGSVAALSAWTGALANLNAVMNAANKRLAGKAETKIRGNKDVQAALSRFQHGVDEVLSRNYSEANLKLVPSWKMDEARKLALAVPNTLKQISSLYSVVFAAANAHAGRDYTIAVLEDTALLDTYGPCVDRVEQVTRGQAKNGYCVAAARAACGHQIDLGCVAGKVKAAISNNLCPEVVTETYKVALDQTIRESDFVKANEEIKDVKSGNIVSEPNPDRTVSTFCPGAFHTGQDAVLSALACGFGTARVRVYGYNESRHVQVEVEGLKHSDNPRKDVLLDVYADGQYVGTRSIRPDHSWVNNVYSFQITERAFQPGSLIKLQFRDLVDVQVYNEKTGQYKNKKAHWIVEAQLKGEDVPFIKKREVHVTKYKPNTWVNGIVNSCVSAVPVLK